MGTLVDKATEIEAAAKEHFAAMRTSLNNHYSKSMSAIEALEKALTGEADKISEEAFAKIVPTGMPAGE